MNGLWAGPHSSAGDASNYPGPNLFTASRLTKQRAAAAGNGEHTMVAGSAEEPAAAAGDAAAGVTWPVPSPRAQAGKSGRVIERITAEKEALRRELTAATAARGELATQVEALKAVVEQLHESKTTLESLISTDQAVLAKKERKIQDLRAALETETRARRDAERNEQAMGAQLEETVARTNRLLAEAGDREKHACVDAAIWREQLKRADERFLEPVATIRRTVGDFLEKQQQDRGTLAQMDVLQQQQNQELERAQAVNAKLHERCEQLGREKDEKIEEMSRELAVMRETQEARERASQTIVEEAQELVKKMKWTIGVAEARGAQV